ncbi:hypothetical protein N7453_008107 [Penicillium expansum]|nr:hypothetical protein N7453_008107 [Penicillium expansum]
MVQKVGDQTPQDPGISICVFQCTRILIRAFDIGLLGSQSTAIELLYQLKYVTKILLPITAYKETEKLISSAIAGGSYPRHETQPDSVTKDSQTEHIRDNNILDILARIRRHDIERGEEVLRQCPASPPVTTPTGSEVPSDRELDANERTVEKPSRGKTLEESLWYTGLESEHMFGSLDTVFDEFGGPSMNFDSQDLEQLYGDQA